MTNTFTFKLINHMVSPIYALVAGLILALVWIVTTVAYSPVTWLVIKSIATVAGIVAACTLVVVLFQYVVIGAVIAGLVAII